MKFPWNKYEELPLDRRNTLQIFITNECNLRCNGCFARDIIKNDSSYMSLEEYQKVISEFLKRDGKQINLLGGEPLLHPNIREIVNINKKENIKTTIYTNGYFLDRFKPEDLEGVKLRVSLYCKNGKVKSVDSLPLTNIPFDANYMVSKKTNLDNLLDSADYLEKNHKCKVFFISSIRELDNPNQEFFEDTEATMPVLEYKKLVHNFMREYQGKMNVHVSKRGVFESTKTIADNKCKFANYFIGGKIIQCPYDIVNLKFQKSYEFEDRFCQHNNTCLMSKIIFKRK